MAGQVVVDSLVDALRRHRILEWGRSQSYCGCAGQQEFDGVLGGFDAPLADDGDTSRSRNFVDPMNLEQRNGSDRRSRQPALHVGDDGAPGFLAYDRTQYLAPLQNSQ